MDTCHEELCSRVRWLEQGHGNDKWSIKQLSSRIAAMELLMALMQEQLAVLNPPKIMVDLTKEEDKGGVGGLIISTEETLAPKSVVPPSEVGEVVEATAEGLDALLRGWTHE